MLYALQDPNNLKDYLAKNKFLADLNNEHETKSALLRDNLASLEKFVLFRFADDFTVVPKDSAWFGGFYGKRWQDLRDTDLYKVSTSCILQRRFGLNLEDSKWAMKKAGFPS